MDIITTHAFYRFTQIVSLLFLPLAFLSLFVIHIEDHITVTGTVEGDNQVILRSPLDGTLLEEILVKPGDNVEKGAPLVRFQDLKNWGRELDKKRTQLSFLKEKSGIYSKLLSEGAQSKLTTKDSINEAQMLEIEIKALEDNVSRLTLRAPFAGCVTELMVKPYAMMEVGTPVLALSAMDEKVIRCVVPESRFPYLNSGQPVAIKSTQFNYLRYKIYTGEVKSYYKYGNKPVGGKPDQQLTQETAYETKIALTGEAKATLPIGSTATCEILVDDQPLYVLLMGDRKK